MIPKPKWIYYINMFRFKNVSSKMEIFDEKLII